MGTEHHGSVRTTDALFSMTADINPSPTVQSALDELEQSVLLFEQQAQKSESDALMEARRDFEGLLHTAQQLKQGPEQEKIFASRYEKIMRKIRTSYTTFAETTFRFSIHLDALLLAAPKYVQAAWGAIHLVLMASVNDQKLKQNVADLLQNIALKFELLEALAYYVPTRRMVEGLGAVYTAYAHFLRDVVSFYSESRFKRFGHSFVKPWESRFQPKADRIAAAIDRVDHISRVAQVGSIYKLTNMIQSIEECAQLIRVQSVVLGGVDENQKLLFNLQQEIAAKDRFSAPPTFLPPPNSTVSHTSPNEATDDEPQPRGQASPTSNDREPGPEAEIDVQDLLLSAFPNLKYAQECAGPGRLGLQEEERQSDSGQETLDSKLATITTWLDDTDSHLLWLDGNSAQESQVFDIQFLDRIMSHAGLRMQDGIVLKYFCNVTSVPVHCNTVSQVVQTFLFQIIRQYRSLIARHKEMINAAAFQTAARSSDDAWTLFQRCLEFCRPSRALVIIDSIEHLYDPVASENSPQTSAGVNLVQRLASLAKGQDLTIKILITAGVLPFEDDIAGTCSPGETALVAYDPKLDAKPVTPRFTTRSFIARSLEILAGHREKITFEDLWTLYTPGTLLYTYKDQHWKAFIVDQRSVNPDRFHGNHQRGSLGLQCLSVSYEGELRICTKSHIIAPFTGLRLIRSLPLIPSAYLDDEARVRKHLMWRGQEYRKYAKGHHYRLSYCPTNIEKVTNPYRVIVDFESFVKFARSEPGLLERLFGSEMAENHGRSDNVLDSDQELSKAMNILCPVHIPAFELESNSWISVPVDHIHPVPPSKHAVLQDINLEERDLGILENAVSAHRNLATLFLNSPPPSNKGYISRSSGLPMLLHGPPSSGMTYTVEALARKSACPVIRISGSLITEEPATRIWFRQLMRYARAWDAFVLMKGVDIFYQAYSETDRDMSQAATAALVREQVERFTGVLFVVTHRVAAFDASHHSLFAISMRFKAWTPHGRWDLLTRMLLEAGFEEHGPGWDEVEDWLQGVCREEYLDGRRMRNLVVNAVMAARANQRQLDVKELRASARMANSFSQQISEQSLRQTQRRYDL